MILGSTPAKEAHPETDLLVTQMLSQQRYAEAYQLLINQQSNQTSVLFNTALCLHWSGNYQAALSRLDSIRLAAQLNNTNKLNADNDYKCIKSKQNQTDDYLHGVSETYVKSFPDLLHDAIVRLKTDCWLRLGNYTKVIAIATPIAHKGYKDITDALKLAQTANDKRI